MVPTTSPPGWQLDTAFGYMSCDNTPAGRLVRLADVLRWIQDSQSLPRVAALNVFLDAMSPEVMEWLYWVQPGNYAKPVPAEYGFGFQTAKQIEEENAAATRAAIYRGLRNEREFLGGTLRVQGFSVSNGKITTKSTPCDPGLPAILRVLRKVWSEKKFLRSSTVDILDDPHNALRLITPLSILLDKAALVWGYGRVLTPIASTPDTFAELATFRTTKANKGTPWFQYQREIVRREVAARVGQPGIRKEIAAALDISVSFVGHLLANKYESKRAQSPQLKSVGR